MRDWQSSCWQVWTTAAAAVLWGSRLHASLNLTEETAAVANQADTICGMECIVHDPNLFV